VMSAVRLRGPGEVVRRHGPQQLKVDSAFPPARQGLDHSFCFALVAEVHQGRARGARPCARHESAPGQGHQKSALLGRDYSQTQARRPTPEFLLSVAVEADDGP
jgi:hypothetical protein